MKNEEWYADRERIINLINLYKSGNLALTVNEVDSMWKAKRNIFNACPHDDKVETHDIYYGEDEYGSSYKEAFCKLNCFWCGEDLSVKTRYTGHCQVDEDKYHQDALWSSNEKLPPSLRGRIFSVLLINRGKERTEGLLEFDNVLEKYVPKKIKEVEKPKPTPVPVYKSILDKLEAKC